MVFVGFAYFGLVSCIILTSGILTSINHFSGMKKEPFSVLNHFISELGDPRFAPHYKLFAFTLISGGIFMLPFIIGLGLLFHSVLSYIAMTIGILCTIACSLIGCIPEHKEKAHFTVSGVFFLGMGILMILFTITIYLQPELNFPRWIIGVSIVLLGIFSSFIIDTACLSKEELKRTDTPWEWSEGRPKFWLNPFLEWWSFFSMLAWIFLIVVLVI
jgi:hypothetical membrane protein